MHNDDFIERDLNLAELDLVTLHEFSATTRASGNAKLYHEINLEIDRRKAGR